jgi:O-antigen/teichoic acid export membrane protein
MNVSRAWHNIYRASPFGSHVLLTIATNAFLAFLGFLTGILAARLLGPEGRGELAAIQTWPSLIATLAMLGLPFALVYYTARQPDRAGRYLSSAIILALLSALPLIAVSYLLMPAFLSAQSVEVVRAARWYLLIVPISVLGGMPFHPLRGRNDFAAWNGLRITHNLGWLIVLVLAWLLRRAEPQFLASGYLMFLAGLCLPVIYVVGQRLPGPFWPEIRQWRRMLNYGVPSLLSDVPQILNFRLDQILMAGILPAELLGFYVVAVAWSSYTQPLLSALGIVAFPRIASQGNHEQRASALAQATRLGGMSAFGIAIFLMIITPWMLPLLFGKKFAEAVPAALVLVVAGSVAGMNIVMEEGLRGLGAPVSIMRAEFGGLAVTAVSLLLLLQPLSITGAALASLFGYTAVTILLAIQARWLTGYSLAAFFCPIGSEVYSAWTRLQALVTEMIAR